MSNHPYPLNTKLKHKKTLVIFVFLIFCFQKLIGQETKNYFGDYYQNCSWLEGVYLSPNGTAFGKIETYYTSHVVQVTDLENGIKIDSSGKELIGFLFQYSIALKDTLINAGSETEYSYFKDSIFACSTAYTYWKDPKTGNITHESYIPLSVSVRKISKKRLFYQLYSFKIMTDENGTKFKESKLISKGSIKLKSKNKSPYKKRNWTHDQKLKYKLIPNN